MKIHRTKIKYLDDSIDQQQRFFSADGTFKTKAWYKPQQRGDPYILSRGGFRQLLEAKSQETQFHQQVQLSSRKNWMPTWSTS
ncbi:hypothetical protein PoB_001259000 [Plakobranchus ocellatus]|uniref:Uncharacterized protein n=1 Tax=Plakobranchus ocellatus TaxID=259542 RepID=A0AAV3YTH2_9GAST|nr:hypothetical protein PoB_001259000 [Plakobranchus ocellatus]